MIKPAKEEDINDGMFSLFHFMIIIIMMMMLVPDIYPNRDPSVVPNMGANVVRNVALL